MNPTALQIHQWLFAPGRTPRSIAYRMGALDALRHHLGENKHTCPYTAGNDCSADFDAYWAGWDEARDAVDRLLAEGLLEGVAA